MQMPKPFVNGVRHKMNGKALFGSWRAEMDISAGTWTPGQKLEVVIRLYLSQDVLSSMDVYNINPEFILMLITAERCFDSSGCLRLPSDERMSTLITPTGMPIEGGSSGAISRSTGNRYYNFIDELAEIPLSKLRKDPSEASYWIEHKFEFCLPQDIPPGIYRLRIDFGVVTNKQMISLNNESFAARPKREDYLSLMYSPPMACSGLDIRGNQIDGTAIKASIYWIILANYNSNGYRGVVAEEDKTKFALSDRCIIHDEVILPLYDERGIQLKYDLEPSFAADLIDKQRNIPWDYSSSQLSIQVINPDGKIVNLGTTSFSRIPGNSPFAEWRPAAYGHYTVVAKGWIDDIWGNRYYGGGTYKFWIGKRLTIGTPIFQGMAYSVGSFYGSECGFAPPVPADVTVQVDFYPDSDPARVESLTYSGRATKGGIFNASQGMKRFRFDVPGEYYGHLLATYTDAAGHLWVCTMRHAGIACSLTDSTLIAHGKKLKVGNEFLERGETHCEGFADEDVKMRFPAYLNFPYHSGDVLLIASEGQGTNRILPVLTYELKNEPQPCDSELQAKETSNVRIRTANGMSPHLYPEYITDWAYYYAAASRQGFVARFLVGEDGVIDSDWPTSATNSGGQICASNNGDLPGNVHRLMGGVVLRRENLPTLYGNYLSGAFILPKGMNNNRVIKAGAEDLPVANGGKYRFVLNVTRQGMIYEQDGVMLPAVQVDPFLPVKLRVTLRYPDGTEKAVNGISNPLGYFAAGEYWKLTQPGVYRLSVQGDWKGHPGFVPGLPKEGGYIFVFEKQRLADSEQLKLALNQEQTFSVEQGLIIEGFSNAETVYYAAITPGAVLDQGTVSVQNGRFRYHFDPVAINRRIPIYDIENKHTGCKEIGRVVHLTFFAGERAVNGEQRFSYARVIMRGTTAIYTVHAK